jgi:hypothetical protein
VSVLTFIEKTFGLRPLNPCGGVDSWDPNCTDDVLDWNGGPTYDFSDAFDFGAPQAGPAPPLADVRVPPAERAWLAAHPRAGDQAT